MQMTNKHKHEVSLLLREKFGQTQCQWPDLFRDMLAEILECDETLDGAPLYDQMAEKLADFIDPTCYLLPSSDGGFGCDRCFTWFLSMKEKPNFCPSCGARVVKTDG